MKKTILKTTVTLALIMWLSPIFAQNQLTGTVNYHDDPSTPVPEVTIQLLDMGNNVMQTTMTNDYGVYFFDSIPNGSYYLASSTLLEPGEVTLQDAFRIMMYLFGWYDFTDYEFAAADVNGSGTVTWADYFLVLINYLLQGQPFPVGDWQFQDVQLDFMARDFGVPDTATVWATGSGDVEGVWLPSGRSLANVTGQVSNQVSLSSETSKIEITSNYTELISGFNLNIDYPSDLMTITGVEGSDGNLNYAIEEGVVKIIWMDESEKAGSHVYGDHLCTLLVNLKVGALQNQSDVMVLQENGMVLNQWGVAAEGVEIQLPKLKSGEFTTTGTASTYPNPVINQLNIRIDSNEGALFIYDLSGKLVQQTNLSAKNSGVVSVNTDQLTSGSYTYIMRSDLPNKENITGRFIKSE